MVNTGSKLVFQQNWNPDLVPKIIEEEQLTIAVLIPTHWKGVLQADIEDYDLSSLRQGIYGAEPLGASLFQELQEKVTENFLAIYGSTELLMSGTVLHAHQVREETLDTIGQPLPNVHARIIEIDSKDPSAEVPKEEVGELIVNGPSVASKLWNNPEKEQEIFHEDGWVFTGDLARITDNGFISLEGRSDNMIISGGMVEHALEAHPDVEEAAVVGTPHERWGEAVKAYVVAGGDLTPAALEEWCRGSDDLADYQRPREYAFVDDLPRNNPGKLDRAELRQQLSGEERIDEE